MRTEGPRLASLVIKRSSYSRSPEAILIKQNN